MHKILEMADNSKIKEGKSSFSWSWHIVSSLVCVKFHKILPRVESYSRGTKHSRNTEGQDATVINFPQFTSDKGQLQLNW